MKALTALALTALFVPAGYAQETETPQPPAPFVSVEGLDAGIALPFQMGGPWIVVPGVTVNGTGPYVFQFDTGAQGGGRADITLVDALGLEQTDEIQAGDGSGREGPSLPLYTLDTISAGGATWNDVSVLSRDYNPPPAVAARGQAVSGILGMGLFADHTLTIDYPGLEMRVSSEPLDADGAHTAALIPSPIPTFDVTVNGAIWQARVDSGSQGGITLGGDVAATVAFVEEPVVFAQGRTVTGSFDIRRATLDGRIEIAGTVLENPEVVIVAPFTGVNLGGQFLRGYVVDIDQPNGLIRLTPAE